MTIATNMAGRGTDIKLGGNKDFTNEGIKENEQEVKKNEVIVKYSEDYLLLGRNVTLEEQIIN